MTLVKEMSLCINWHIYIFRLNFKTIFSWFRVLLFKTPTGFFYHDATIWVRDDDHAAVFAYELALCLGSNLKPSGTGPNSISDILIQSQL
jgi:hypothetical protein